MSSLTLHLACRFTGVKIGTLELFNTIGGYAQIQEWQESVMAHGIFNLPSIKLFEFVVKEYERIIKAEEAGGEVDDTNLRISFFALLRTLDCIKQDFPVLPSRQVIYQNITRLWKLATWYHSLDSIKFRFPLYHISKLNENGELQNLNHFLSLYWDAKESYESGSKDIAEQARIRAAEQALDALSREWIVPVSKRILWKFVRAHLPEKYQPDAEGWLGTIFLGSRSTIADFDEGDIHLHNEIIESSIPLGNPVNKVIRDRLNWISETWKDERTRFTILLDDFVPGTRINGVRVKPPEPGEQPKVDAYPSKAAFYVADAKWSLSVSAWRVWKKENPSE